MPQSSENFEGYYIGVMTGTSGDGLDIALVNIERNQGLQFVAAETVPFSAKLREKLIALSTPEVGEIEKMGRCDTELGSFIGLSIMRFLENQAVGRNRIIAIGSHGQTIRHRPPSEDNQFPFTLQIGNPFLINEITGIKTIADFRRRDVALNGQGAPLVPPFHESIFKGKSPASIILNIGGISNITTLGANLTGFDTGPGNCLMDAWIMQKRKLSYDEFGEWASSGTVHEPLLKSLRDDPFFRKSPPKSTGREYFNLKWAEEKFDGLEKLDEKDVQSTFCELTATTIISEIQKFSSTTQEVIVCGGGRLNTYLITRLKELGEKPIRLSEDHEIDGDYIEAAAFAWLAFCNLNNLSIDWRKVTGASKSGTLGVVFG